MYAIIETGGKQYWVKPGQNLQVEKLDVEAGQSVDLKVLWANDTDSTSADAKAGSNTAKVTAQVVKHLRGKKIIIFKKRPKKGYERTQGHRQDLSEIKITDIKLG
ncbi:large subunit ribosomal protein L21 [Elusimicrobium simillimum]|uniref:50S ribosomal protein L21 n=1 Tax=Elusimicrobium simillimum TaxID=3143438 RepID=UPI003C6FC17F